MSESHRRSETLAAFIASAPLKCALAAIAILTICGFLVLLAFTDPAQMTRALRNPEAVLDLAGAGLTAVAAIIAAFRIHVRGRTLPWRATPLVIFAGWQGLSLYQCFDIPAQSLLDSHSPNCLLFILAASIPIGLFLFSVLRLHDRNLGWSASAMSGLAISAAAIVLLQFFHGMEADPGDWSIHLLAMGIVVGSSAYAGQVMPRRQPR